jgi:cell wall-associated NlpC family hydrolase
VTDGRQRFPRVLTTLCIAAVGGSVLVAPAAHAAPDTPDVDTVQERVVRLDQRADRASERRDGARSDLTRARTRLRSLHADLERQQAKVAGVRNRVAESTGETSTEADPYALVVQLSEVAAFNVQQRLLLTGLGREARRLQAREVATRHRVAAITKHQRRLAAEQTVADAEASRAERLLATLKERAEARASRSADRTAVATSGRAAAAVRYAMAQVGKSYVYGAAGPSAFDCSGLTMMAWAQAGVGLPHSSGAQMGSGRSVSQSELQPGDLVFYYSPVSHVGMYIGNGQIVNALNPGAGVRVSAVNSMPYSGAVRPG